MYPLQHPAILAITMPIRLFHVTSYKLQLTSQILTTGEEGPRYQTWTSNETLA